MDCSSSLIDDSSVCFCVPLASWHRRVVASRSAANSDSFACNRLYSACSSKRKKKVKNLWSLSKEGILKYLLGSRSTLPSLRPESLVSGARYLLLRPNVGPKVHQRASLSLDRNVSVIPQSQRHWRLS